ncbi:probable dolichyl pyrophosphate Man9GlcNAc2 alpha-1,3-glucosyltransferase [Actinidia eriantha]|uniref:probable dolichyl pyrophosphate Man9GlcNAc2 alpha-1,3-glucosyltransferase n=1 Tax=Actinidia eriantha TaxID=165200 RepID=UPI00258CE316|nr:probable dolichyl pyrophosphate Man9GlcNAc2 alpha-1,3-glucosyltransferase [Actinidia eriantha]
MEKRKKIKTLKDADNNWWWLVRRDTAAPFLSIIVFAILLRVVVSFHPYSGVGKPPKYGDFEAQRHWMEITLNLPACEWNRNSTTNDLSYWGLDYPPLTAYQSYFHVFYFVIAHYSGSRSGRKSDVAWHIAMILLNPCQIPIDHGHFQVL